MEAPEAKRAPATLASRGSQRRKGLFVPANELPGLSRAFSNGTFCILDNAVSFFLFLSFAPVLWFLCSVFVCCSESSFPRPTNLLQGYRKSMCRSRQFVSRIVQTRLSDEACAQMRIRVGVVRQLWCLFTGDCRGAAVPQQSRRHHIWNMDSSRLWILRRAPERWLSYCTEKFFAFKKQKSSIEWKLQKRVYAADWRLFSATHTRTA